MQDQSATGGNHLPSTFQEVIMQQLVAMYQQSNQSHDRLTGVFENNANVIQQLVNAFQTTRLTPGT